MRRGLVIVLAAAGFALAAVSVRWRPDSEAVRQATTAQAPPPRATRVQAPLPQALSDSAFGHLIERISEPGAYFDTDNLISNESSYLHVMGGMRRLDVTGGAYLGVGPDQNFSYIALSRPRIAFIIDVRRDNLLQHLMFKALFEAAPTRIEYLCLLFGRRPPDRPEEWRSRSIAEHLEHIEALPADRVVFEETRSTVAERAGRFGYPLSAEDLAVIERIRAAFFNEGTSLRYRSHGRPPRPSYPTLRRLLLETDREGRQASYLANEDDYRFVRELERRNLIIPVVGDFAGDRALREIAAYLHERGEVVSAFYLSNVEFYLWQNRTFTRFARNITALPFTERTVMIRSLFGRVWSHPQSVSGYNSVQLLQTMTSFVSAFRAGSYRTYGDLVYGDYIDLRQ